MKRYHSIFILVLYVTLTSASCSKLSLEHEEARNIEIAQIDFSTLHDGRYDGYYEGGIYSWRENECQVTVDSTRLTRIVLVNSAAEYTTAFLDTLYNRIIRQQTLQVDVVSGSTLDSKACLKAVEDALLDAVEGRSTDTAEETLPDAMEKTFPDAMKDALKDTTEAPFQPAAL